MLLWDLFQRVLVIKMSAAFQRVEMHSLAEIGSTIVVSEVGVRLIEMSAFQAGGLGYRGVSVICKLPTKW